MGYIFYYIDQLCTTHPAHILDLYCVQLLNATPFCKNYTKLCFDAKHLEKGLNREVKFLVPFFQKKYPFFKKKNPFWPILNAALNFQNMPCHLFQQGWLKLNLIVLLDQLRLAQGDKCRWQLGLVLVLVLFWLSQTRPVTLKLQEQVFSGCTVLPNK